MIEPTDDFVRMLNIQCSATNRPITITDQLQIFIGDQYIGDGFFEWDVRNRCFFLQSIDSMDPIPVRILDDPFHKSIKYVKYE